MIFELALVIGAALIVVMALELHVYRTWLRPDEDAVESA